MKCGLNKYSYLWSLLNAMVGRRAKGSMRLMRQLRSSLSPERFSMELKKATRKVGTAEELIICKTSGNKIFIDITHLWQWIW